MWKKLPLIWKILTGMFLGVGWGLLAVFAGLEKFTYDWIQPWGTIFLNLLKLIAVPLIFISLVKGISSLTNITRLSRMGIKTVTIYLVTTVFAVTVGLVLVNIIQPGNTFPEEKKLGYQEQFGGSITEKQLLAEQKKEESPLQFLVDIVPENVLAAATDNASMLQVIFFAILFGLALVTLPHKKVEVVKDLFSGLNDVILKIVDMIMLTAPYGVFALMAALIVDFSGDIDLFAALGLYSLTVIAGLLFMILLFYPSLIRLITGIPYGKFLRGILPAQLVAFSTSSSAATLPVTKEQVENELGVSEEVSSFVLPIGVTINMDGTSCYQAVAAVFIAQVFGVELSLSAQLTIVLTATLASIGSPGIPGGSIVMLIIVLSSVGLPVEGLALILGIDRPLDMLRTVVNITGDSFVSCLLAKSEGELVFPPPEPVPAGKEEIL
ncbi:MAG TPA: dicarboxylate/amino acid:cation symporter [Bacteroidetes bacterium]|nr:dicarboxylate/amino acid:cation symporter [Bacteroidota bacterium]